MMDDDGRDERDRPSDDNVMDQVKDQMDQVMTMMDQVKDQMMTMMTMMDHESSDEDESEWV